MNRMPNQLFLFSVNLYCVSNLLMAMCKYYQTELPFHSCSHYWCMNNSFKNAHTHTLLEN